MGLEGASPSWSNAAPYARPRQVEDYTSATTSTNTAKPLTPKMKPSPKPYHISSSSPTRASPALLLESPQARSNTPTSARYRTSPLPSTEPPISASLGTFSFTSPQEAKKWNVYCSDGVKQAFNQPPSPPPSAAKKSPSPRPPPAPAPRVTSPFSSPPPQPTNAAPNFSAHEPEVTVEPPQCSAFDDYQRFDDYHDQQRLQYQVYDKEQQLPPSPLQQDHYQKHQELPLSPAPSSAREKASYPRVMTLGEMARMRGLDDLAAVGLSAPQPLTTTTSKIRAAVNTKCGQDVAPFATASTTGQVGRH